MAKNLAKRLLRTCETEMGNQGLLLLTELKQPGHLIIFALVCHASFLTADTQPRVLGDTVVIFCSTAFL